MAWEDDYERAKMQDWRPTKLSADEETKFQRYLTNTDWFKEIKKDIEDREGIKVNDTILFSELAGPDADYDYRGAWKAGIKPECYANDGGQFHWASSTSDGRSLKAPDHSTLWMEYFMRETGIDPTDLGLRTPEEAIAWSRKHREKK